MAQQQNSGIPAAGKPSQCDDTSARTPAEAADALSAEPGIFQIDCNPADREVSFAYDPRVVDGDDIELAARTVAPLLEARWSTCTMRVNRQGGRSCEACALAVESKLQSIPGVRRATVSYLNGALSIAYDDRLLTPEELAAEVQRLGLKVAPSAANTPRVEEPTAIAFAGRIRAALTLQRLELLLTVVTLLALVTGIIAERIAGADLVAGMAYAVAYVAGGAFGLRAGLQSLRELTFDIDLLMITAAVGAAVVGAPFEGAMLLFLFSLSNVLQSYALGRTRNAIRALMALRPGAALVRRGDQLLTLPIEEVTIGDHLVVRPGDRIPLDGVVIEGVGSVDQAPITGESVPVTKEEGDKVLAGTINQEGGLEIRVTHLAADSTIARLIQLVEEAHSEKAQTQRVIDRAEQYYAAGVVVMTVLAVAIPLLILQEAFQPAFYRAMTLMVAASPCALVISTPATVLSAIANGARKGILFKGGIHVEKAAAIRVVAFDKTGTLTAGRPRVTDVVALDPQKTEQLLTYAAAVESRSEHPLAEAIVAAARERGLRWPEVEKFQSDTGRGVAAVLDDQLVAVGNRRYYEPFGQGALAEVAPTLERLENEGKTAVVVAILSNTVESDGRPVAVLGVLGVADVLRPDAPEVVEQLKARGVQRVVMLTGDNERVAAAIAGQARVDAFHADLLPADKMRILKEEEARYGPVAMVGDGVNDAPALATATIGIAMGAAGTDVALETADIVLMADDLSKIPYLIGLSKRTRRTLWQNLVFAIGVIIILIAAVLGIGLALPLSVIGHEGSTVLVSLNGLRLLAYRE